MAASREEFLISVLAGLLKGEGNVAVGTFSPIPAAAALLAQTLAKDRMNVMVLGNPVHNPLPEGGSELFDRAAQGRIDVFFLSGGQIDGGADLNLVGAGDYPNSKVRFPGTFGSAYMYMMVPRTILFRDEHSPRVLVPKVDFISAAGTSPANVHRAGGPTDLVTGMAHFSFDPRHARFALRTVHPGHSADEVERNTGFDFDRPDKVSQTPAPAPAWIELIRGPIAAQVAETYPDFAATRLGFTAAKRRPA